MSERPMIKNDAMYQLLRNGKIDEFNKRREQGEKADLTGSVLRAIDLRGLMAAGLDMSNAYLSRADLRGIDFTHAVLQGASIHNARISGAYFPSELSPEEILMSQIHGTRMRYRE